MGKDRQVSFGPFLGSYIVFILFVILLSLYLSIQNLIKEESLIMGILLTILFIFSIYILYLMFSRKKIAKFFSIAYVWALFLIPVIIDWTFYNGDGLQGVFTILSVIILLPWAVIWTIYFIRSEKVRNIFVN